MKKATYKRLAFILMLIVMAVPAEAALLGASGMEGRIIGQIDAQSIERIVQVQTNSGSGRLIAPSVALRNALSYAPGSKGLGVSLKRGARPVYVVKVKKGGQVRRVRVDARNGAVLGQ